MTRIIVYFALLCALSTFVESAKIKEVLVIRLNTSEPEAIEETITFETGKEKTGSDSGIVEVKYVEKPKPSTTRRPVVVKTRKQHNRHLRRRCCHAGELAAKHGLSCLIPRHFNRFFFNLVTQHRMKYQGTINKNDRHRFRSKAVKNIYKNIGFCVKRQRKSVVQKCCLGYKTKQRRRFQG
ncbi:uncharacterized protein LOC114535048 [Dendronephthya gigantea]|uniref:uncharacterized protein LOC114535048 n=1 Tax=Dendronephthya gigantea TaxID=151771 RepID=UPI00106DA2F6|nr:uncharacterized protein LOC114535048 [Dendronephthya gigantea]